VLSTLETILSHRCLRRSFFEFDLITLIWYVGLMILVCYWSNDRIYTLYTVLLSAVCCCVVVVVVVATDVQGRSEGCISVYIPPNQSTLNFLCGCFVSLTQDKFDIVQFMPTQIKFLATPLLTWLFSESFRNIGCSINWSYRYEEIVISCT